MVAVSLPQRTYSVQRQENQGGAVPAPGVKLTLIPQLRKNQPARQGVWGAIKGVDAARGGVALLP